MDFIESVALYVNKYREQFGIKVASPIIAQAILESNMGRSDKVTNGRNNYFGLKWRNNRCAISNEYFEEYTSEQNSDGSYIRIVSKFCKFKSLEECVIGYFQWTNIPNYANLKGVTNPRIYLENIKKDKYATSLNYVDNLMNVINKYNLTKYDSLKEGKRMIFNIHAGHNPDGKIACGAVGLIKESTENRKVKDEVIKQLRFLGHTVYDCTVDDGTSQVDILRKIVRKCNAHKVDFDVSIHFNCGARNQSGNGVTTGTEIFISSLRSKAKPYAQNIVRNIARLGYRLRDDAIKDDIKTTSALYVIRNTKAPCMLIECCFVDDKDDVDKYNYKSMADAIVKGLVGDTVTYEEPNEPIKPTTPSGYIYNGVDYSLVFDAIYYATKYPDLKNAFDYDISKLLKHFIEFGMSERRQAISTFNVNTYIDNYVDLRNAFGNDYPKYYMHYITNGYNEKRKAI